VHIEVGPFAVDVPGSKFIYRKPGYYIYHRWSGRETLEFKLFPGSKSIWLWGSNVTMNGIANPITVKVQINDWSCEATNNWKRAVYRTGTTYTLR
jgi:hypothetical protein